MLDYARLGKGCSTTTVEIDDSLIDSVSHLTFGSSGNGFEHYPSRLAMTHYRHKLLTVSAVVGVAATGISDPQPARAAVFNYTSTINIYSSNLMTDVANGSIGYTKADLPSGDVGYELRSLNFTILNLVFTLRDLLNPAVTTKVASLVTGLLPASYQPAWSQYEAVWARVVKQDPNEFDYIGDGGFPPPDAAHTFGLGLSELTSLKAKVADIEYAPAALDLLFGNGGTVTVDLRSELTPSQLPPLVATAPGPSTEAVPEPTTIAGLALAGSGLAAARRRKQAS